MTTHKHKLKNGSKIIDLIDLFYLILFFNYKYFL